MMKRIASHQRTWPLPIVQRSSARFRIASFFAVMYLACLSSLHAQLPTVASPADDGKVVQSTSEVAPTRKIDTEPPNSPSNSTPNVPDFDIDLDTEEFENFGEEDFEVEEKLSKTGEATVLIIKATVAVAVVLLIAFMGWKLFRRKGNP